MPNEVERPIVDSLGNRFESTADAARAVGRTEGNIVVMIEKGERTGGRFWAYAENGVTCACALRRTRPNSMPVVDDQGNHYESISDAARVVGVHPNTIRQALKCGCRAAGRYWAYAV